MSTTPQHETKTSATRGRVLDGSRVESWSLSRSALDGLLARLDPDPRKAAAQYERVRTKLVKLFEWRGSRFPEELADETIDRVAMKIESGVVIEAQDPYRYFCSVAFYVYKEVLAEEGRRRRAVETPEFRQGAVAREADPDEESEGLLQCLDRCLERMTPRTRDLVIDYHRGEKRARIDNRSRLADELGISRSTLRLRVHRIRQKLEHCVNDCSGGEA